MGYSLSWLAIKGKSPQAVRDELGFHPTGKREEFPESELSACEMPNGWYLIVSDHTEQRSARTRPCSVCHRRVANWSRALSRSIAWRAGRRDGRMAK
jgi:hypothetical protein